MKTTNPFTLVMLIPHVMAEWSDGKLADKKDVIRGTSGSLSVDALIMNRDIPIRGFDLKTGRPWSKVNLAERIRRFGVPIQQIRF